MSYELSVKGLGTTHKVADPFIFLAINMLDIIDINYFQEYSVIRLNSKLIILDKFQKVVKIYDTKGKG